MYVAVHRCAKCRATTETNSDACTHHVLLWRVGRRILQVIVPPGHPVQDLIRLLWRRRGRAAQRVFAVPTIDLPHPSEVRGERGAASQVVRGPMTVVIKRLTSVVAPLAFHAMGAVGRTFW